MKMPGFILGERQSTPFCSTLLERRSCWRFPCCRDAATLPCQVNRCRRPDRIRATIISPPITSKPYSRIAHSTTHSKYRPFVGTLAQGLDLDHLCSFPGSRFADAGLAGEQHDLAFTIFRSGPAPQQQFPSDEGGQAGRVQRLEAAFNRNRPQRRPGPCRPGDALEVPVPEVLKLEEIAEKFSRALGDDDLFGSAIPCRRPGQGLLGASLGKHAIAGAVRRQSERDQPLFSGQSTTHRGTGNAPFPAQLGPSSAWR
jgi:hypothetical protein